MRTSRRGPRVQFSGACEQSHWWPARHTEGGHLLSVVQAATNTERQRSQIKEDTVEPSVPAREFNLKAYATITWHNDRARLGLEPRLADHHSQAARTATLPTAPPRQAHMLIYRYLFSWCSTYKPASVLSVFLDCNGIFLDFSCLLVVF